jgi:L-lactate dehydrogenase
MKIGIVGAGMVGSAAAYAMVMHGVGRELVLVDKFEKRAVAEAEDLYHAVPFAHPLIVSAGTYESLRDASVVIMSAGVNQKPGETRLQLLERNAEVFREVIPEIVKHAPRTVIIVATNPVDIMTHLTQAIVREAGGMPERVLGSGTTLDTARFRALLATHLGVDSKHIHAYVLGEHGDSEVLTWSLVSVGGIPLEDFCRHANISLSDTVKEQIDTGVRRAAYRIIEGKGATYYGIGSALSRLTDVVLHDQRAIMTVCAPIPDVYGVQDVTISLPRLVKGEGADEILDAPISEEEAEAVRRSAQIVRDAITSLGL